MLVQCFVTSVTWKYSQFVFLDIICLNLEVFHWGQVCVEMVRQMCSQLILTIEGDHPDSFVGNTLHRCYLFNACVCVCFWLAFVIKIAYFTLSKYQQTAVPLFSWEANLLATHVKSYFEQKGVKSVSLPWNGKF